MSLKFFLELPKTEFGNYVQGIPNENEFGPVQIVPEKDGLKILVANPFKAQQRELISLKKSEIISFDVEDQSTIESKIALSRMLLVGIFALAWKKRKTNPMAFILIKYKDDVGLEQTVTLQSSKPNAFQTYNNIKYNLHKIWKQEEDSPNSNDLDKQYKDHQEKVTNQNNNAGIGCIVMLSIFFLVWLFSRIS